MKITKRQLRKIIKESVHGHLDGELTNLVFAMAQEVNEKYNEITVQDVLEKIASTPDTWVANMVNPRLADYFVSSVRKMTYEDIVDRMHQLVDMGELADGYEDFFEIRK